MDKWIRNIVDEYNVIIIEDPSYTNVAIRDLSKGFRRFVSNHLFYYEKMTTKTLDDSHFNFMLVYRSTPFSFNVDFYFGYVLINVGVLDEQRDYPYFLPIGKYSISDFLYNFVTGLELQEIQSHDFDNQSFDDDQFEIPF